MQQEELVSYLTGLGRTVATAERGRPPGDVVSTETRGDYKWAIDADAEAAARRYIDEATAAYGFDVAVRAEDAAWGDGWRRPGGTVVSTDELDAVDYALLLDQVEGSKNYTDDDRYTAVAAIDPAAPTIAGMPASTLVRWDGPVYVSDGETAYRTETTLDAADELTASPLDTVDASMKLGGCMIARYVEDYATFTALMVDEFDLAEKEQFALKTDGTTAGDLLGVVEDNRVAVDLRALHDDAARYPYPYDVAPAAKIAQDAGAVLVDAAAEDLDHDLLDIGAGAAFLATPPGDVGAEIREELLPRFRDAVQD